jgi:hypothetical protein
MSATPTTSVFRGGGITQGLEVGIDVAGYWFGFPKGSRVGYGN